MPSHSENGASVRALLWNLNAELDRKQAHARDDQLSKTQRSARYRLGPSANGQDIHSRGGHDFCGAIFMCNRRTWKECLGQNLFGLPVGKKSLVDQVAPGMKLFLFEYERRQLWGVFEAISHGAIDIVPNAYTGGSFPCQVRVKVPEDCVALNEDEFYDPLKDNYFCAGKFHFDLTGKQVYHLTSLFEKKYLRASGMKPALLEYEKRPQITGSTWPLLLTNGEACPNREADDALLNSQDSNFQLVQDGFILNTEETIGFVYRDITNFSNEISQRKMRSSTLVPLSKPIGQGAGELAPVYSSLTKQETFETLVISRHGSRLHKSMPSERSIWTRISGHAKPLMTTEILDKQEKVLPSCCDASCSNEPSESSECVSNACPMQEVCMADVIENAAAAAVEFSVGFKRRRGIGKDALASASETQTSKQRRKLRRPSFETEDTPYRPAKLDLNLPLAPDFFASERQSEHIKENLSSKSFEHGQCDLAFSLCEPSEAYFPLPEQEVEENSNIGNEYQALNLYQTDMQERMSWGNDALIDFVDLTNQVKVVQEEHTSLGIAPAVKEQHFDVMLRTAADCIDVESVPSDMTRVDPLNEAPCTPSKEAAACSGPDLHSEASLSPVDLKMILSRLQVSGIKLQLGSSPCLILQLGDSNSSIGDQDKA